ncbi:MAG TPA: tyrosine-type recombinase/integrase [Chthoniobacterales bacterium]|nr:tyrosine-type recombinase/integrase [Chthoniobacterales bacterium]
MFFRTRAEAAAECLRQKTLLERHSREAIGLSQSEMSEVITARNKLAKYNATISKATAFFVDHEERIRRCKMTIRQLAEELMQRRRQDGRSKRYLEDVKFRLGKFCETFGDRRVATVTTPEVDQWQRALPYSPQSRTNYLRVVGALFSEAERMDLTETNPVARIIRPKRVDRPPGILTVDETRALLEAAHRVEPEVLPMLAVGAFAGLRTSEIHRLHWNEIDLVRGEIDIPSTKSKTARRRFVPILPNLAEWLSPYSGRTGSVTPKGYRRKIGRVRQVGSITDWPDNALRHGYASYRYAATDNAHLVASELGHPNSNLLMNTYRNRVRRDDAERYFNIRPAAQIENIVAFRAKS